MIYIYIYIYVCVCVCVCVCGCVCVCVCVYFSYIAKKLIERLLSRHRVDNTSVFRWKLYIVIITPSKRVKRFGSSDPDAKRQMTPGQTGQVENPASPSQKIRLILRLVAEGERVAPLLPAQSR